MFVVNADYVVRAYIGLGLGFGIKGIYKLETQDALSTVGVDQAEAPKPLGFSTTRRWWEFKKVTLACLKC